MIEAIETPFKKLKENLQNSTEMNQLVAKYDDFLKDILNRTLLTDYYKS